MIMKERIEKKLKERKYNFIIRDDGFLIKSTAGNLLVKDSLTGPVIVKKNNFNNYCTIAGFLFFMVVIIIDREEISNNILYSVFALLFALYYFYNRMVLEINKQKVYDLINEGN